jgi:AcrR family transcriptional regulator
MAGTGRKGSEKRTLLLDTAEKLILDEGYAAVSTRRVALEAGVKPPLVHYYFRTTEDLLLAVYDRAAERAHQRALGALAAPDPLEAFWNLSKESAHSGLGTELYALANHRKLIRSEVAQTGIANRTAEAEALARVLEGEIDASVATPMALLVLLSGVSRVLVMEEAIGITAGHDEVRTLMEWLLARVRRPEPQDAARR